MTTDAKAVLQAVGLPDKEAILYLTLLRFGEISVSTLAQRTRLPRSTVQFTCQQLVKRGMARSSMKNRTTYYSPEPPEKLMGLLAEQQQRLSAKERILRQAMGGLTELMNPHIRLPRVEYYEGERGLIELYEKILALGQPIASFEDKGEMVQFFPAYVRSFVRRRVARGISNRVICPEGNPVNLPLPQDLREVRTLPADHFPFTGDIKVCGDLVSLFSFEKYAPVGIAIRHREIADNVLLLHSTLWAFLDRDHVVRRGR